MDRFLAPHTPEAVAYSHISQNSDDWDIHHLNVDEALVAGCAAYNAFDRYLRKEDLFILPRTRSELESVLKRYSYDSIHNAISRSRSTLQPGGYSRVCESAENSIKAVLNTGDNLNVLLHLHRPSSGPSTHHELTDCPPPTIKSN
ncbi:hypothetical protein GYMLUDRAFT_36973 [Collybiopsis luxurians FD-317 M1]|nr:hypothetical protein GYMLUDRAFT_36973 [Collybiopsis luxurians FD-317 M1]